MLNEIERMLLAIMARMLELDRDLTKDDAVRRLTRIADDAGLSSLTERLASLADRLVRKGVLNPSWLAKEGLRTYFFLADGRPGFLEQLVRTSEQDRAGVSLYIVYGDWDALVVLHGTEAEADQLYANLQTGAYGDPVQFSAEQVILAYRHRVRGIAETRTAIQSEVANAVALDFDDQANIAVRDRLTTTTHVLGPTWVAEGQPPYPVVAFVGLMLRGVSNVKPDAVLEVLMRHESLKESLIHLFHVKQGTPFHYFLKLCCTDMQELDEATTAIGAINLPNVRPEGTTLVVARGTDQLPMFRRAEVAGLSLGPDLTSMIRAGERVFAYLSSDEQLAFNQLDEAWQVAVVKSLSEVRQRLEESTWEAEAKARLESAISTFARECTSSSGRPNLTGAVTEVTTAIEGSMKRLLSKVAYSAYDDPGKIQSELKLPTRVIRKLSLGKVVQALRVAREHDDFQRIAPLLEESWLDRVDRFVQARNAWVHDAVQLDGLQLIDEAHRTIMDGVELSQWIEATIGAVRESAPGLASADPEDTTEFQLPSPSNREFAVFISHATADGAVAERIAMGLKVFGYRSWYAEWEFQAGDSIVGRIESALAQSDVLLVLLSPRSVASEWVRRELNSALMAQLSGQDVVVIPIVIEDCEIPPLLQDIFYIDFRGDFEQGLYRLLGSLRRLRDRGEASE